MRGRSADVVCSELGLREGTPVIETVRDAIGYRRDQPSPAFDGRYVGLDVINPTIMQRLFGG